MKKERIIFGFLCGIFAVSLLLKILYYFYLAQHGNEVSMSGDSAGRVFSLMAGLGRLADIFIWIMFIGAILRMFKYVLPLGESGIRWRSWIVSLYVCGMIVPLSLYFVYMGYMSPFLGKTISWANNLILWSGPVLLTLFLKRFFLKDKRRYGVLYFVTVTLMFVIVLQHYLSKQFIFPLLEGKILRLYMGEAAAIGWKSVCSFLCLLFIARVNRLQFSDSSFCEDRES